MERRSLGAAALAVGAVGLGCMPMSWAYSASQQRGDRALRAVHAALDAGVAALGRPDARRNDPATGAGAAGVP
ncbi:hypothetical protein ACPXCX_56525, partial [Streptomyces sp. DT225]